MLTYDSPNSVLEIWAYSQDMQANIKDFLKFFLLSVRMIGKNIKFDDIKINNSNFYGNKRLFKIDDIDVNKTLVSKKVPYGKKKLI